MAGNYVVDIALPAPVADRAAEIEEFLHASKIRPTSFGYWGYPGGHVAARLALGEFTDAQCICAKFPDRARFRTSVSQFSSGAHTPGDASAQP